MPSRSRHAVLLLAMLLIAVRSAARAAPIVTADIVTVANGDVFSIAIEIADAAELTAWQLDLSFDPAIVQAKAVSEGQFLSLAGYTLFVPGVIDNVGGLISLVSASYVDLPPGPSGSGILLSVEFLALAPGVSPLSFTNVFLDFLHEGFTLEDGQVTVTGLSGPDPVSEPASLVLLAGGVGLALHCRHRGRTNRTEC